MSALEDLLMLLRDMAHKAVPDAEQALSLAHRVRDEELLPAEVLDALAPGTKVRDVDSDKWRKHKDGLWVYKPKPGSDHSRMALTSAELVYCYGPVQVIPWKGKK